MDLAIHTEDWALLLREAIARSPEPVVPALILEWLAEAQGDQSSVRYALRTQAEHATDPSLRAALWIDVALGDIDAGHPQEAIDALERACESEALVWQARSLQLRTAREHERWDVFVRAATSMARLLEAAVEGDEPSDPLNLSVPKDERLPMAALLWQEAAACSARQFADTDAAAEHINAALRLFPDRRATRLEALLIQERRGDLAASEEASEWFRTVAPEDPAFVAHEVRRALSSEDFQQAIDTLRDAAARYPDSDYAQACRNRRGRAARAVLVAGGTTGCHRLDGIGRSAVPLQRGCECCHDVEGTNPAGGSRRGAGGQAARRNSRALR